MLENFQHTMEYVITLLPSLLSGATVTVKLFFWTLIFALPLGLPIAFGAISKIRPIRYLAKTYILIFRGTPLMLQLFFFYFYPAIAFGIRIDAYYTAIFTFVLNYAAYFAEIYRGGINSIDQGQYEAAHSLGLSKKQTVFDIVIPQTMRIVLPPISNEAIVLIKDTALVYVLAVGELLKAAKGAVNRDVDTTAFVIAAIIYLIFTLLLTFLSDYLERRFSAHEQKGEV